MLQIHSIENTIGAANWFLQTVAVHQVLWCWCTGILDGTSQIVVILQHVWLPCCHVANTLLEKRTTQDSDSRVYLKATQLFWKLFKSRNKATHKNLKFWSDPASKNLYVQYLYMAEWKAACVSFCSLTQQLIWCDRKPSVLIKLCCPILKCIALTSSTTTVIHFSIFYSRVLP